MQRSSATVGLVLIGTTLSAAGFSTYQIHKAINAPDASETFYDGDFNSTTQPSYGSSGYSSTHYYHNNGTSWSDDYHRSSSSGSPSSSSFHSSTSRGGFGSSGHSGGS